MTDEFATLTLEQIGGVRRITLNRPAQHNPLTPRCIRELLQAVARAEGDASVRVGIGDDRATREVPCCRKRLCHQDGINPDALTQLLRWSFQ